MDLVVLFGYLDDGFESYIEALAAISDFSNDSNPQWLQDEMQRIKDTDEYKSLKIVRLRLSDKDTKALEKALGVGDLSLSPQIVEIEGA